MVRHIAKNSLILLAATITTPNFAHGGGQIHIEDCRMSGWKREWNEIIVQNVTPRMLEWENDFFGFPGVHPMIRWRAFVQAIIKNESDYDTHCDYQENEDVDFNVSRGLLQLSTEDATNPRYASCKTVTSLNLENIYDPATNIKAGLEIMDMLIGEGEPLSSYWSTTNEEDEKGAQTRETLNELLTVPWKQRK